MITKYFYFHDSIIMQLDQNMLTPKIVSKRMKFQNNCNTLQDNKPQDK